MRRTQAKPNPHAATHVRVIRDVRDAAKDEFHPANAVSAALADGNLVWDVANGCAAFRDAHKRRPFWFC